MTILLVRVSGSFLDDLPFARPQIDVCKGIASVFLFLADVSG
jgi:hypothetical protein